MKKGLFIAILIAGTALVLFSFPDIRSLLGFEDTNLSNARTDGELPSPEESNNLFNYSFIPGLFLYAYDLYLKREDIKLKRVKIGKKKTIKKK